MASAIRAGVAFFGLVFALGFVLGALRHDLVGRGYGRDTLVLLEMPLMLAFAWWAAGWSAGRFAVPVAAASRLVMGAVMFALLRLGEWGVGALLAGQAADAVVRLPRWRAWVEIAPQVATAFFPLMSARLRGR